jgi:hypothetical protein
MVEEYNQYGEIIQPKPRTLSTDQKHRIHQTKDMFDGDCSYCQAAAQKWQKQHGSWWSDEES